VTDTPKSPDDIREEIFSRTATISHHFTKKSRKALTSRLRCTLNAGIASVRIAWKLNSANSTFLRLAHL